ncbi:unnamed protein product [Trichobilharzia regenti]|nr:unnamed protein product [Trichobilharzia regenti]
MDPSQAGLFSNPAAAAAAAALVNNPLMNPLVNASLLTGFNLPNTSGLSPNIGGGLLQTPTNHPQMSPISDPTVDNRLQAQLSLNPLTSLNYLLNISNATGNPSPTATAAALAAAANGNQANISPAALALLMSAYGQGANGLSTGLPTNTSFVGVPSVSHPSINGTSLPTTSLLNLNSTTPNTTGLNVLTGKVSANDLNAYSAAMAYQRLLNMASSYQTIPPSLLTSVNPVNSLSGAMINNPFPSLPNQTISYANNNNNNANTANNNNGINVSMDQPNSIPLAFPATSRNLVTFTTDMNGTSYDYANHSQELTANMHATLSTGHHPSTSTTPPPLRESIECGVNASMNF